LRQEQIEAESKKWKEETGYDKRSLVETAMWRFKGLFGGHFKSKNLRIREQDFILSLVINKMTNLGIPESKWIVA